MAMQCCTDCTNRSHVYVVLAIVTRVARQVAPIIATIKSEKLQRKIKV